MCGGGGGGRGGGGTAPRLLCSVMLLTEDYKELRHRRWVADSYGIR